MTEATFCVCVTSARLLVLFCFAFVCFHLNLFIFNDIFLAQYLICCFPHLQFLLASLFFCLTRLHDAYYLFFSMQVYMFSFFLPRLHFCLFAFFVFCFFQSFPCLQAFNQTLLLQYLFCCFPLVIFAC